jgi:hypothetical protein
MDVDTDNKYVYSVIIHPGWRSSMEVLFSLSSLLVFPFWALMVFAPRWRVTVRVAQSPFIVVGPVLLYAALVVPELLTVLPAVARPELPTISGLLGTARGTVIAWAHFLAFDLFVARWMFLDARARGVSAWVMSPLLMLTLLLGPLGLGAYVTLVAVGVDALRAFARRIWSGSRPLAIVGLASLGLLVVSLVLQVLDPRVIAGAPAWMKPAKFAASIAVTAPVLAWIIDQLAAARRRRHAIAGAIIAVVAALELGIITVQAARGVPSHFNAATRLDAALFSIMGGAISVLWLAEAVLALGAFRQRFVTPARTWGIRLGLLGTLLGGAFGFLMARPTSSQIQQLHAGKPVPMLGAHAVGVPDGGPGLPMTRWSTQGGDIRAPHFFGLHAIQSLPMLAFFLERRRRASNGRLVLAAGVAWIGLTLVGLSQALRGQPLLAPDAVTAFAALFVVAAAGALAFIAPPRRVGARTVAAARGS